MIALYVGAFKPPHVGHFNVVRDLLKGTANAKVYDLENYKEKGSELLGGNNDKVQDIDKVVVFISSNERDGITQQHSKDIWNIYKKKLGNVEIVAIGGNPMLASLKYAREHANDKFYAITGVRDEEDFSDLKRLSTFKNTDNVLGLALTTSGSASKVRASNFRKAIIDDDLQKAQLYLPYEIEEKDKKYIISKLKDIYMKEDLSKKIEDTITGVFENGIEKTVKEGSGGTPIASKSAIRSEDRAKLVALFDELRNSIDKENFKVEFYQNHIRISPSNNAPQDFDYTPYMASLLEYMIDNNMKVTPLPEIKIRRDIGEAANFFGRTAFYSPDLKEVVMYVEGRHPKDVMRSFAHEMVHHMQNLEGRLENYGTTNTNEDDALVEIEKEAYMLGNITFRNWEDKIKNSEK